MKISKSLVVSIVAFMACSGLALAGAGENPDSHAEPSKHGSSTATPEKPAKSTPRASKGEASKPTTMEMEAKPSKGAKKPAGDAAGNAEAGATAEHNDHAETKEAKPEPVAKATAHGEEAAGVTAEQAMAWLTEGNARWVSGNTTNPNIESSRRAQLAAEGQKPFVTVLSCSDSRIPTERVFDRGVGEVFTVRVAGSVAGGSETGTIEYGVGHLKTPLLVVMSHSKCGAVKAACAGADVHGKLKGLIDQITPAVDRAKRNNPGATEDQLVSAAIRENVWQTIFDLFKNSPELREKVTKGELKVVGAICDITTGKVDFMGEHPWQNELITAINATSETKETSASAEKAAH
jgi:carbonic anhydrase